MNSVLVANHWVICFLWSGSDIQDPRSPMSYSCPFPKVRKWLSGEVLGNLTHLGSHWIICWLHSKPLKLVCSLPEYKVVWKHSMWCSEPHGRIVVFSFIDLIVWSYFLWDGHFIYDVSHNSVKLISLSLLSFFLFFKSHFSLVILGLFISPINFPCYSDNDACNLGKMHGFAVTHSWCLSIRGSQVSVLIAVPLILTSGIGLRFCNWLLYDNLWVWYLLWSGSIL